MNRLQAGNDFWYMRILRFGIKCFRNESLYLHLLICFVEYFQYTENEAENIKKFESIWLSYSQNLYFKTWRRVVELTDIFTGMNPSPERLLTLFLETMIILNKKKVSQKVLLIYPTEAKSIKYGP